MNRMLTIAAFVFSLCIAGLAPLESANAGHHEKAEGPKVIQAVTVSVEPGMLGKYRKQVKKLAGVLDRVGSSGVMRMWSTTQGGPDTGQILVGIEHASAASWAADSAKVQGDDEWQDIIDDLHEIRRIESSAMWTEITPEPGETNAPAAGSVLVVTGVSVKPGKLAAYRERLSEGQAIVQRLKLSGKMRMWQATLAGPGTGNVAIGVEYPDLPSFVSDQAKLEADGQWKKLLSGLDDLRTLGGRWLYQEITP